MANTTGKKYGGREKGTPNKATQDIKEILNEVVDFGKVVGTLYKMSLAGDSPASKILLEYGFGKQKQKMDLKVEEFTPPQIILDGTATNKTE